MSCPLVSVRTAVIATGCALALAACGSSSNSTGSSAKIDAGLQFSQCMRSHGVTNFPDPSGTGDGFQFNSSGLNPQSPAFQNAQKACRQFLPGPVRSSHPSETARLGMLAFAKCLRDHGLADIPDPTTNPPTPGNGDAIIGRGGLFLVLPAGTIQSPDFQQVAKTCGLAPKGAHPTRAIGPGA